MIRRHSLRTCLFAAIFSLTVAMAAPGQERTSEDILTLDRAIELARTNNRVNKRAKFDIDRQLVVADDPRLFSWLKWPGLKRVGELNAERDPVCGTVGLSPSPRLPACDRD